MNDFHSKLITFRPRARIMRTLGQELISSETVAVLELVKNAYDADARKVLIRFSGKLEKGNGSIEIIDNGHGMDMEVIEKAWMEPATDEKRKRSRSRELKRRLLGSKGIGRFAVSRLANELHLVTRGKDSESEIYAVFDWTQFDDESKYLDEIEILTETRPPEEILPGGTIELLWENKKLPPVKERTKGTILRMKLLNKQWNAEGFKELQRGLSRLVSPFKRFSDFKISVQLPEQFFQYSREIAPPAVIKYPHYSVTGKVKEDGNFKITLRVLAHGVRKEIEGYFIWLKGTEAWELFTVSHEKFNELTDPGKNEELEVRKIETGPFDFELRIWDRDELENIIQKTNSTIRNVRTDLDSVAGINIYRDGFRVLPYGEPGDDWLRMDIRRVQKPTVRLSQNQVLGYINISADKNPEFRDLSNREGLDENQALEDLRNIMITTLNEIENIRYNLRPRKKSEKAFSTPVQGLFNALNLKDIKARILQEYPKDEATQLLIEETEKGLENQVEEIQTVIARYQNLATLGTLIDVVLHDGRHPLDKILIEAILGREAIEVETESEFLDALKARFSTIETQGKSLSTVFNRIEPFGGRRRGKPVKYYMEELIRDAIRVLETEIKKLKVKITFPDSETLVRIDPSEIQQVIINLLNNSLYWLQLEEKNQREIFIEVKRRAEDHIEVLFADSGPGVPSEYRERIFEPYFSTKPNGVGLGLAIAGEIVSDYYKGKIELLDKGPLKGAAFRITLRKRV